MFGRGVTDWQLNRVWSDTRGDVNGLPEGFRIPDLRHYYASLLIPGRTKEPPECGLGGLSRRFCGLDAD